MKLEAADLMEPR